MLDTDNRMYIVIKIVNKCDPFNTRQQKGDRSARFSARLRGESSSRDDFMPPSTSLSLTIS
eukprot:832224-Pyramimonas_sp.AAC.1